MPTLNPNDAIPLYRQLEEDLRKRIASGELKLHEKLPTESQFAQQYHVSLLTVRKAVSQLVEEGLLKKKQGKGTFVCIPTIHRNLVQINSFSEMCRMNNVEPGAKLLEAKIVEPEASISQKLELPENEKLVCISRLRLANNMPMSIETNYFGLRFSFLLTENLEGQQSLFETLKQKGGVQIDASRRDCWVALANKQEAALLNMVKGKPVLVINSVTRSENVPIFAGHQVINTEWHHFTL